MALAVVVTAGLFVGACADKNASVEHTHKEKMPATVSKAMEANRTESSDDDAFRTGMHVSYLGTADDSPFADGGLLYEELVVTGESIGERQVYSVRDLEELASLSLSTKEMNKVGLTARGTALLPGASTQTELAGLDLARLLVLCGASKEEGADVDVYYFLDAEDTPAGSAALSTLLSAEDGARAMLAFGVFGRTPLVRGASSAGFDEDAGNLGGPLVLVLPTGGGLQAISGVTKLVVGPTDVDSHYELAGSPATIAGAEPVFTLNVYAPGAQQGDTPAQTHTYTAADLAQMALQDPAAAAHGYFGTIGDQGEWDKYGDGGIGGWIDWFEGIDLAWILKEKAGLDTFSGRAVFYGRSGDAYVPGEEGAVYAEIADLSYLERASADPSACRVFTRDGIAIPGAVPLIAYAKNGHPLLAAHDHDAAGYVSYNKLNQALEAAGVSCEVGVVKNDKGPFVAGLGNLEGYYGGYQQETGGDCIRIDVHPS